MTDQQLGQFIVPRQRIVGLVKCALDAAKLQLDEARHDSYTPMLHVVVLPHTDQGIGKEQHLVMALLVPFNEDDDKRAALRGVAKQLYGTQQIPIAACLTTEAWLSIQKVGAPHMQPRNDHFRKEVVIAMALSLNFKECVMGQLPLSRMADVLVPGEPNVMDGIDTRSPLLEEFYRGFFGKQLAAIQGAN